MVTLVPDLAGGSGILTGSLYYPVALCSVGPDFYLAVGLAVYPAKKRTRYIPVVKSIAGSASGYEGRRWAGLYRVCLR